MNRIQHVNEYPAGPGHGAPVPEPPLPALPLLPPPLLLPPLAPPPPSPDDADAFPSSPGMWTILTPSSRAASTSAFCCPRHSVAPFPAPPPAPPPALLSDEDMPPEDADLPLHPALDTS